MSQVAVLTDERIAEIVEDVYDDRIAFVRHILHAKPTSQQAEALQALDKHDSVTIRSGHGCGKSTLTAWAILHFMATRPGIPPLVCKVPCTAPSKHQLYDVLWSELAKWHSQMNPLFCEMFQWTKERYAHKAYPETWFAAARTATKDNPESLQGFHGDYVFRVAEEASGVPEAAFLVLSGATGSIETKELLVGNPTRTSGHFSDSHTKFHGLYKSLRWSCLDTPSPPLDKNFIFRMEKRYGRDSNVFRVRVLGEFPTADGNTFIPYDLADSATEREVVRLPNTPKVFGCDIARYGDDNTAIAIRQGDYFYPVHILSKRNTMEVSGYIAHLANQHKPVAIFVDVIGIGAGVVDRLTELGYPVIPVNVTEASSSSSGYYKLRDELWGKMLDWLNERRGHLSDDDDKSLVGELTTPKYRVRSDGRIQIESKDEMRKRGCESPNRADACLLTFAHPVSEYTEEVPLFWHNETPEFVPLDPVAGY